MSNNIGLSDYLLWAAQWVANIDRQNATILACDANPAPDGVLGKDTVAAAQINVRATTPKVDHPSCLQNGKIIAASEIQSDRLIIELAWGPLVGPRSE